MKYNQFKRVNNRFSLTTIIIILEKFAIFVTISPRLPCFRVRHHLTSSQAPNVTDTQHWRMYFLDNIYLFYLDVHTPASLLCTEIDATSKIMLWPLLAGMSVAGTLLAESPHQQHSFSLRPLGSPLSVPQLKIKTAIKLSVIERPGSGL